MSWGRPEALSQSVYRRNFSAAVALANPGPGNASVALDARYRYTQLGPGAAAVDPTAPLALGPQSGRVLLRHAR